MMQYYTSTILLPTIGEFFDSLFCGPFDINTLQKQKADSLQAVCLVLCSVFTSKGPQKNPSKNSPIWDPACNRSMHLKLLALPRPVVAPPAPPRARPAMKFLQSAVDVCH